MVGLPSKKYISLAYMVLTESDRPLNTIEIQERIQRISHEHGRAVRKNAPLGLGQLAGHMNRSSLFHSLGRERCLSGVGNSSRVTVWGANNLTEVATKWLSYEHPRRKYKNLPSILKNEIDRIKEEIK